VEQPTSRPGMRTFFMLTAVEAVRRASSTTSRRRKGFSLDLVSVFCMEDASVCRT